MSGVGYFFGKVAAKHPLPFWGAVVGIPVAWGAISLYQSTEEQARTRQASEKRKNEQAERLAEMKSSMERDISSRCIDNAEATLAKAKKALTEKRFDDALSLVTGCDKAKASPEILAALQDARTGVQARTAKEAAEKQAKAVADAKKARAEELRIKKTQGVSVGMTKDDVLASSWGRPNKVNRTTTADTIREQWVYDGGYLYFRDGILTTIQN